MKARIKLPEQAAWVTIYWMGWLILQGIGLFAQTPAPALRTEIYQLSNGLTVYLNADESLPSIFGAVAVRGGSKCDPPDATGIAHYFEHIMFKGTDKIGTLDFEKEKPYLDSIAVLYDKLALTNSEAEKLNIQKEINRLSIKAAEYAIPNELERILSQMGCTNLNAGTGYDGIVYYNILPANQLEKWMEIYSHRFINPVYRLFQSELETVYEEYNMYRDNRINMAFEEFMEVFYPDHPYGTPIIGFPENLKNPSMSKMHEYFQTYYVANNMALVLSGNFKPQEVKPLIEKYFGRWRSGSIPESPSPERIKPFNGRTFVERKLTPIKFGIRGYRSVPANHNDAVVLDILNLILSNPSQTGLLDELVVNNQLMAAMVFPDRRADAGAEHIFFIPKVIGQSLEKAEQLIEQKINDLKNGRFDDQLLEAVKIERIVNYERDFEDQYRRGYSMINAFLNKQDWEEVTSYPSRVQAVTREDVIRAANQYLGADYLIFYSRTGIPKKPEVLKPPFEKIPAMNTGMKSEYAMMIERMPVKEMPPHFIQFGPEGLKSKEVLVMHPGELIHFYYVENKVNNLFELRFSFGTGTYHVPVLNQAAEYLGLVGPEGMSYQEFRRQLQLLGGGLSVEASRDYFSITITGPDFNLKPILNLTGQFIQQPAADPSKIKNLAETEKTNMKFAQKDPETLGSALFSYAVYGNKSSYLNKLSLAEIKKLKPAELIDAFHTALSYEVDIHYSGTIDPGNLLELIKENGIIARVNQRRITPVKPEYRPHSQSVVYFLNDKTAIQSKDYFFIAGNTVDEREKPLLNAYYEYLDGGMSSLLFQEIREFRSLAYATGASVLMPFYPDQITTLTSFVGTQADKTQEAIEVMYRLISSPPDKPERLEPVRKALMESINSQKPTFRWISNWVAGWVKQGYSTDPRKDWMVAYQNMTFDEIIGFHQRHFYQKPVVITIIGDRRKIGTDWLNAYGKIEEVNKKQIFR